MALHQHGSYAVRMTDGRKWSLRVDLARARPVSYLTPAPERTTEYEVAPYELGGTPSSLGSLATEAARALAADLGYGQVESVERVDPLACEHGDYRYGAEGAYQGMTPDAGAAAGGVETVCVCGRCGARRWTARNAGRVSVGPWLAYV